MKGTDSQWLQKWSPFARLAGVKGKPEITSVVTNLFPMQSFIFTV